MTGLRCLLLFTLVASSFLACNAEVGELEQLLRRVIAEIKADNAKAASDYIQRLMAKAKKADGQPAIGSISVFDLQDASLLASAGAGPVGMTSQQATQLIAAFKSNRFDSLKSSGLAFGGNTYRLSGSVDASDIITFYSRNGTLNVKKAGFGLVVAQSPKQGMNPTVNNMADMTE